MAIQCYFYLKIENMKNYIIYGLIAVMTLSLSSCADDSEILEPTVGVVDNKFAVPDDATGPEAELRRKFYADNGSYLLFSDLIGHEYVGKDAFGQDVYKDEYIDFNYNLTSMNDAEIPYDFLESIEEKSMATSLIETYIYPHIKGGKLTPFSILLVKNLKAPKYGTYGALVEVPSFSCWRCLAISVGNSEGDWMNLPDNEKSDYATKILKNIIMDKLSYSSPEVEGFSDLSYEYAYEYLSDLYPDWDRDMTIVYELGYMRYFEGWGGDPYDDSLPSPANDFSDYIDYILTHSQEDFMAEFGMYPRMVSKYNIVRDGLIAVGYKF